MALDASDKLRRGWLLVTAVLGVLVIVAAAVVVVLLVVYPAESDAPAVAAVPTAEPVAQPVATPTPAAPPDKPKAQAAEASLAGSARYPLRALLDIDATAEIDPARERMRELFPTVTPFRHALLQLRYDVPLSHGWFGEAQLAWANERAGKLKTVGLRPLKGQDKLANMKEIAACLTKSLGKPEVREVDHLAGELSYFYGQRWPKAWVDIYSGYLWMAFEDPKGVAPVTFANVLRTLDACPVLPR